MYKYPCRRKGCYNKQENGRCRFDDYVPKDEDACEKYYPIEGFLEDRRFFDDKKNLTRPARAGIAMAKSIIEMVNLMYQNNTAEKFLVALNTIIAEELNRRTIIKMDKAQKKKKGNRRDF